MSPPVASLEVCVHRSIYRGARGLTGMPDEPRLAMRNAAIPHPSCGVTDSATAVQSGPLGVGRGVGTGVLVGDGFATAAATPDAAGAGDVASRSQGLAMANTIATVITATPTTTGSTP